MTDEDAKKKQYTTRELVAGGGILLMGLPLIAFTFCFLIFTVVVGVTGGLQGGAVTTILFIILTLGYFFLIRRTVQRSMTLIQRVHGLRREKQRTSNLAEHDTSRLELSESGGDTASLADDEQRQIRHRS